MTEMLPIFILTLIVIVILAGSIKIAGESERFAVFMLGRFQVYRGPGLVLIAPYTQRAHRIRIGDIGLLKSAEFAQFGEIDIPIANVGSSKVGQAVRIDSFDGVEPRIVASSIPAKVICPNCGHQF
jgi:hypothetical protein